ncbi:helix-turn-helix domain-containing protein [Amycolatopsis sp. cg9]|uniref:helix-turn-helix domain-containing protein n=1 Tax=Amycolatopsis sp. cg9 TaxID=3238801 RepID=UPI0035248AAB
MWAESSRAVLDEDRYQKILGDELRRLRRKRGWTRKHLRQRLTSDISLQTLSTYEHGTRRMSVLRLVELCLAFGECPQDLIAKVHQRATRDHLTADAWKLAGLTEPHLAPLSSWATQLLHQPDPPTHFRLNLDAVGRMAQLCGMTPDDLVAFLGEHAR